MRRAFHTPSSNSCSRSTVSSEYMSRLGRQAMKAFFDCCEWCLAGSCWFSHSLRLEPETDLPAWLLHEVLKP